MIVVIDADLLAFERIRSTAESLGKTVHSATHESFDPGLEDLETVIIDLDRGGEEVLPTIGALAESNPGLRILGFFSHIAPEIADRARTAGCTPYPRGRFYRELSTLLS